MVTCLLAREASNKDQERVKLREAILHTDYRFTFQKNPDIQ